jgi:ubiquinone/menaquinone biosynthesis C-methylase UbiE
MFETENAKAWETLYSRHYASGGTFLPAWGLYSSGSELTEKLLKLDGEILEIACGVGESVPYVVDHRPLHYTGLDFSKHALEQAQKSYQLENVSFIQADMSKDLPLDSDSFDEIFSVYGIGWSQNIKKTFSEIYRILKSGGTFTFSWDHYLARVVDEQDGKIFFSRSYNIEEPTIHRDWNHTGHDIQSMQEKPSTWFQLLREAGFEVSAFHEITVSAHIEKEHVFSNTYSENRSKIIPFSIVMQAKKHI